MVHKVVSNTGPILHLTEINLRQALNIFPKILIPEEVANELRKSKVPIPKNCETKKLASEYKDAVKILANQYNLDFGESEAIALALQEKLRMFFTDDLDAREVARNYHLEVHGTVGIILRAFRDGVINKKTAIEKMKEIKTASSLFITQDLIEETINAIKDYK